MKKLIKLIIMTVLFLTTFSLNVFADGSSADKINEAINDAKTISEYGESEATTVEIEGVDFYVVERDSTNEKALLMSKDIYDVRFGDKINHYSESTLKTWMDNFYTSTLNSNKRIMNSSIKECLIDLYNGVKYSLTDEHIFPVTFDMVVKYGDKLSTTAVNYGDNDSKEAAGYWVLNFANNDTRSTLYYQEGSSYGLTYSTTPVQVVSFGTVSTTKPSRTYYYLSNGEVSNSGGTYKSFSYPVVLGTNENFGTRVCMWYDMSSSFIQDGEADVYAHVLKSGSIGKAGKTYSSVISWSADTLVATQSGDNPVYEWDPSKTKYVQKDAGKNEETFQSNQGVVKIKVTNKSNDEIVYKIEGEANEGYEFLEGYAPTSQEETVIQSADKDVVQKMKIGYNDSESLTGYAVDSDVFTNTLIITKTPYFSPDTNGEAITYKDQLIAKYKVTISRNV